MIWERTYRNSADCTIPAPFRFAVVLMFAAQRVGLVR